MTNVTFVFLIVLQAPVQVDFTTEFEDLRSTHIEGVGGRDPIVHRYEKLIATHPKHPRVGEAMLALAHVYLNEVNSLGVRQDPTRAKEWFQKAVASSQPGSPCWRDAQIAIVGGVQPLGPDEAMRILKLVKANAGDDVVIQLRIERYILSHQISQKKWDEARETYKRIVNWRKQNPKNFPSEFLRQQAFNQEIMGSVDETLHALTYSPGTKAKRANRIREFMKDAPDFWAAAWAQRFGQDALEWLERMPERSEYLVQ